MNKSLRALALSCLIFTTGCASTPTDAQTLATAEQSATLATQLVDEYVKNGKLNRADLVKIQQANNAIHAALITLETANLNKQPLSFASFNAAIAAFNSLKQ